MAAATIDRPTRVDRWVVFAIVGLAIALRVVAFTPYGIHHPDEAIQYLEQAHRLVFGQGLVPWEYRAGMRSWLPPLLLAGPMALGKLIAPGSILPVVLARLVFAALTLIVLPAAWAIGARVSRAHAVAAMAVIGCWYECVYFGVHVLTEVLSAASFLAAAALLGPRASRARLVGAGALLAFAAVIRLHYAPAIALFALLSVPRDRSAGWAAAGALAATAVGAVVDAAMGQVPFAWAFANVGQNLVAGRAAEFGVFGPWAYAQMLWLHWSVVAVPIALLALVGGRRFPALLATALCVVAIHMVIGHKEYRFIWLAVQILLLLAAIGSVDIAERWHVTGRAAWAAPVVAWLSCSLLLSCIAPSRPDWRRFAGGFELARAASETRACGLGLVGASYWASGGQTFLRRPLPLYYVVDGDSARSRRDLLDSQPAYDAVIAPPDHAASLPAYHASRCAGNGAERLCLFVRPGGCHPTAVTERHAMQRVLIDHDR